MKKFFARKDGDFFIFEDSELNHFNVLRCYVGEQVLCLGRDGNDYICEVVTISKKQAKARILSSSPNVKNPAKNITVFQGLVKGEKLDLIVQKLTELGVSSLFTFESNFAMAKANDNKIERLNKISEEACKQCGRSVPLIINPSIKFNEMIEKLSSYDVVLFANEKQTERNLNELLKDKQSIAIIVGSEGGFSDEEIAQIQGANAINFGLGARILRAETACIAMSAIIGFMVNV